MNKMKRLVMFAAVAQVAVAGPALAQHASQTNTQVYARVGAIAPGSPGPGANAFIVDGVPQPVPDDPDASGSTGPNTPGATANWARASESGVFNGQQYSSSAYAEANLATGKLKAEAVNVSPTQHGGANADARASDTVFFTNTTGSALLLPISFAVDGSIFDPFGQDDGGIVGGAAVLQLVSGQAGGGAVFFENGPVATADSQASFSIGRGIYSFTSTAPYFTLGGGSYGDFSINTVLSIPTGLTSLGISLRLFLNCTGGSSCYYGNSGTFSFGELPTGLSYTSQSGVFLTDTGSGPGAVPEPATWALMILGFGAIGAALRRRRTALPMRTLAA